MAVMLMANFVLTVNGSMVARSNPPLDTATLVSFSRNYDDPAELVFRVLGNWRNAPYPADAAVILTVDNVVVFEGLTALPRPVLSVSEFPAVEYTAYDRSRALRGPIAVNQSGFPEIALAGGTLASVAAAYFALASDLLTQAGVSTTPEFAGGADAVTCLPVSLSRATVDEAIRQIAAAAPGVRVLMAPPQTPSAPPKYRFVKLTTSPSADVIIDNTKVRELNIRPNLEGRCGAIKVYGGQTQGEADVEVEADVALTPAWNPALEANWTFHEAYQLKEDGTLADAELAKVFRLYAWSEDDIVEDRIRRGLIKIVDDPNPLESLWQERKIERIDMTSKTVLFRRPNVAPYHTRHRLQSLSMAHKGRSVGVPAKLRVAVSGVASTPIYIQSHRVPEIGFSGRAYSMAPISCGYERPVSVPGGVDTKEYAIDAFEAFSEPTVIGTVPLDSHLPPEFWMLDRRINVRTNSNGTTGYEDLQAPLMGIDQQWANGGTSSLEFNRDDSEVIAGGTQ